MGQDSQTTTHRLQDELRAAIKDLMAHINMPGSQVRVNLGLFNVNSERYGKSYLPVFELVLAGVTEPVKRAPANLQRNTAADLSKEVQSVIWIQDHRQTLTIFPSGFYILPPLRAHVSVTMGQYMKLNGLKKHCGCSFDTIVSLCSWSWALWYD